MRLVIVFLYKSYQIRRKSYKNFWVAIRKRRQADNNDNHYRWFFWRIVFRFSSEVYNCMLLCNWNYCWDLFRIRNNMVRKKWKPSIQNRHQPTVCNLILDCNRLHSLSFHPGRIQIHSWTFRFIQHFVSQCSKSKDWWYLIVN